MQSPTHGELGHVVASRILPHQTSDVSGPEPALGLPLTGGLRRAFATEVRQGRGKSPHQILFRGSSCQGHQINLAPAWRIPQSARLRHCSTCSGMHPCEVPALAPGGVGARRWRSRSVRPREAPGRPRGRGRGVEGVGWRSVRRSTIGAGGSPSSGCQLQLCTTWMRSPARLVAELTVTDGGSASQACGPLGASQRIRSAASAALGRVPTVVIRPCPCSVETTAGNWPKWGWS